MAQKKQSLIFSLLAIASMIVLVSSQSRATESTLHAFTPERLGGYPRGGLIADAAGNLYGVTGGGGAYGEGTVFEFTPDGQGAWSQKILYSFQGGADGSGPEAALIFDAAGNLYGTTVYAGPFGYGTVFRLKPNPDGTWTERILRGFDLGKGGGILEAGVVFDQTGNLYGTTAAGGVRQGGVVFELSPSVHDEWKETVLYSFTFGGGASPPPSKPIGVVIDQSGNIFGVTAFGGYGCSGGCGIIYQLTPTTGVPWKLTILHNFAAGSDGAFPAAGLISDAIGNLYGVTNFGGRAGTGCNDGCGTVFELARGGNNQWTESVLYSFQGASDGTYPGGTLAFDSTGNLYGTNSYGGVPTCPYGGCGTVFELTPSGSGQWTENVLWRFSGGTDGSNPSGGLVLTPAGQLVGETFYGHNAGENGTVFALTPSGGSWDLSTLSSFADADGDFPAAALVADAAGNLYGTTTSGGALGLGAVFELTPTAEGRWNESLIYSFQSGLIQHLGGIGSGTFPSILILDAAGNLYGETETGSPVHAGTVYELSPSSGGGWTEKTLHIFKGGVNGNNPSGGLVMDQAGNLYGTTVYGGRGSVQGKAASGNGVVFELSPEKNGTWTEKVIYRFGGYPSDGAHPHAALIFDRAGNLYGTTFQGGGGTCQDWGLFKVLGCGTVFELSPSAEGWTENVLYAFTSFQSDGAYPSSALVFDQAGNLFGTTKHGGGGSCGSCGAVFELSWAAGGGWTESLPLVFPDPGSGILPLGNLILDQAGNLYGTTSYQVSGCTVYGCGTVFELSPAGSGWNASVLYSFIDGYGGGSPMAGVIWGPGGSLYGTTVNGGAGGDGVVFAVTP